MRSFWIQGLVQELVLHNGLAQLEQRFGERIRLFLQTKQRGNEFQFAESLQETQRVRIEITHRMIQNLFQKYYLISTHFDLLHLHDDGGEAKALQASSGGDSSRIQVPSFEFLLIQLYE
jgi:hypothetical protein